MKRAIGVIALLVVSCAHAGVTGIKTPPHGVNKNIQYNGNGVFGSTTTFQYNINTNNLQIATGTVTLGTTTTDGAMHISIPDTGSSAARFFRFDLDGYSGGSFTPDTELIAFYSNSAASSSMAKRGSIYGSFIPNTTASLYYRDENNVNIHSFSMNNAQSGSGIGYTVGTAGYVYGNQLNVKGAVGFAGEYVYGSTTAVNYVLYAMDASSGPVNIIWPSGGIVAGIGERWYRACKVDSSTNVVRVGVNTSSQTVLNYQGECVDYWNYIQSGSDTAGRWLPIGRGYWNDVSASTVTASSVTVSGQGQFTSIKFSGDGSVMTTAASGTGSGDSFGSHTATQAVNMAGFAINNSSSVTTSSMSVTGATTTFDNVSYVWPTPTDVGSSASARLLQYDPSTHLLSLPVAITDGARLGSTQEFTGHNTFSGLTSASSYLEFSTAFGPKFKSVTSTNTVALVGPSSGYEPTDNIYIEMPGDRIAEGNLLAVHKIGAGDTTGQLYFTTPSAAGAGDNFGSHVATKTVTAGFGISVTTISVNQTLTGNTTAMVITSTGTGNALLVTGNGAAASGVQSAGGGIVNVQRPGGGGVLSDEVVIYSSVTSGQAGSAMLLLKNDATLYNDPLFRIINNGSSSNPFMRVDDAAPDMEMVNTSTNNAQGLGKWEPMAMANGSSDLQGNSRSFDDTTFENVWKWKQLSQGGGLYLAALTTANGDPVTAGSQSINFVGTNGSSSGLTGYPTPSGSATFQLPSTFSNAGQLLYQASSSAPRNWEFTTSGAAGQVPHYTGAAPVWGPPGEAVTSVSASYTVTSTDTVILASATSAGLTITLDAASAASSANYGKQCLTIIKVDGSTGTVTIARAGSDTVMGSTVSVVLRALNAQQTLVADGTSAWWSKGKPATTPPYIGQIGDPTSAAAVATSSDVYCGFFPVNDPVVISSVALHVTLTGGNMCVAVIDSQGNRLATSGSVATPAAGDRKISLTSPVTVQPGMVGLCLSADNTTATFTRLGSNNVLGTYSVSSGVFPIANPIALTTTTSRIYQLIGVVNGGL